MHCLICDKPIDEGALTFLGAAICTVCEGRLLELAVEQNEYNQIVEKLSLFWEREFLTMRNRTPMESDKY